MIELDRNITIINIRKTEIIKINHQPCIITVVDDILAKRLSQQA